MARRLQVGPKPAPNGTTHLCPGEASQFAVMTGDDVTCQPLGKFRFTKYWRRKWFELSPATDQR